MMLDIKEFARDEDGGVLKAMHVRASDENGIPIIVEYQPGESITGRIA